jgi:thiol:disulfide interchange protein DsbG
MNRARFLLGSLLALSLGLAACSKTEPETAAAPKRTASVEIVSAEAKGFTAGAMMNANAVYVFFDAQCPHCSKLWEASVPLHKKARFVWIPVGLLNAASSTQGAALLSAADPVQSMSEHEKSILAGQGGISASASITPAMEEALKNNTRLFNNLGIESVPFTIARNARTGATVTRGGAMDTAALAELIGVDAP